MAYLSKDTLTRITNNKHIKLKFLSCGLILLLASCTSITQPTNAPTYNRAPIVKTTGNPIVDMQAQAFKNVQYWSAAYEQDPTNIDNILKYAKSLSGIGSDARATTILAQGAAAHPQNSEIIRAHAKLLSKKGLNGPALRKLQVALNYAPNDWRIYNDVGSLHGKMSEHTLAISSFNRALNLSPNNPNIHTNIGLTYIITKQLTKAEHHLGIAIRSPNATAKMRGNYALALGLQGKYDASRRMFLQDLTTAEADAYIKQFKKIHNEQ